MAESRQNLAHQDYGLKKKKKGCFMTIPTILFFITLFVAACIAVALIMWFAIPRKKCATEKKALANSCRMYIDEVGKDAFCAKPNDTKSEEDRVRQIKEEVEAAAATAKAAKAKAEAAALRTGLRLNKTLIPHHYDLSLWPRFYEENETTFTGNVTIHFTCKEDSDVIVLHVDTLTVNEDSLTLRGPNIVKTINRTEEDVPRQFFKIYPDSPLMKNTNYTLRMSFNGTVLHEDLFGFYRRPYTENNRTHYVVSTQFQISAARRSFPLFDEPFFKATFSVTMVRKDGFTAVSNTERMSVEDRGGGWYADTFKKTPIMSSYLLAYAVSEYGYQERYTTGDRTRTRVYVPQSLTKHAEYANNISARILETFEEWTGMPYTLDKLDQMLIPDFWFGGMENWGLVKYHDTELLYNPDYSTNDMRRHAAYVISHELAHMWFGNLVTCRWWDDAFLNEALADYFGHLVGLKAAEPGFNVEEIFVISMQIIMKDDGLHTSQPIRLPKDQLEHHDELFSAFSFLIYYKGAAVIRMIRDFLGQETFQRALQRYLRNNAYKTVVDEDLYSALQTQAELDGSVTWDTMKTNISGILKSWIDQQNFPLLHVTDLADGSLKVTQSRFSYDQDQNASNPTPLGDEFLWDIPLRWTDSSLKTSFTWMHREKEIRLHGVQRQGWKYLNPGLTGFYRVRYGDENWNAILYQLVQNHTVFPVENRAGFIDDAFELARAGLMEEVDALRSTQYLRYEREYLPWYPGLSSRARINLYLDMLFGKPAFDQLEKYLIDLVIPAYNLSGWTVTNSPGLFDKLTRIVVINAACSMNYKPCVDQAKQLYRQFMNNPNNNPIHPDLRRTVYCTGVAEGGIQELEFLKGRLQHNYGDVYIGIENRTVANALACVTKPNMIRRYLDFALAYNLTGMFVTIAMKREARDTVWNYIIEHWDDFTDGNKTRIHKPPVLTTLTSRWNTDGDMRKFEDFVMTHNETELAPVYAQIMEKIEENKDWLDDNMAPMENWLKAVNTGQTYKRMPSRRRRRRSVTLRNVEHSDFISDFQHMGPYSTHYMGHGV